MLVLSRKPGESIDIGEETTVTVLEVRGDRVRLGIVAPKEIRVVRTELGARKESVSTDKPQPSENHHG